LTVVGQLAAMARELARPELGQVILAEGNVSGRDGDTLWIKASGQQMADIDECGFVQVYLDKIVSSLGEDGWSDEDCRRFLNESRTDPAGGFPSTETFMHAWLLTLPDVNFVAHTHPTTTLGVMCGPRAVEFAEHRYFPDQIVLCGPRSVLVPYVAPGLALAKAIRDACASFTAETSWQPKTVLLENHGLIALGKTPNEAIAACRMTEKAAKVFVAAGGPRPLTDDEVAHIYNWTDEHFRQGKIWSD
jgi:rhamnose utilization protein RhaD (predicted bifunctional aldolase and dehydrogenase)